MAICNKCGAELPEGSKFCTSCGAKNEETPQVAPAPVEEAPVYVAPEAEAPKQESVYSVPTQAAPNQKEKKPVNKKLFIIIGAAVLALIVIIVVIVLIVNTVKKNAEIKAKTITFSEEYLEVVYDGYDTLGTVSISFSDEFEEDAYKAMGYAKNTTSSKAKEKLTDLKYAIDFEISERTDLSNGDTITVKVVVLDDADSKKAIRTADVIIKEKEFTFTVDGLEKVIEYNPFDDLEVTTYGSDGNVYVDWDYIGDEGLGYYDFSCDNKYDLSVGDKFTITIDDYSVEYLLEYYGVLVTETSKSFTVDGADKYITSAKQISADLLADMKDMAEDEIYNEYDWADCTISELEYQGMYFLNLTDDDSWSDENIAVLVYTGTATPEDDDYDPFTVYMGVNCYELYEYSDGTQTSDSYVYMIYNYEYVAEDSWDNFYGFFTEKELYDDVVSEYSGEYSIEVFGNVTDYSNWVEPDEEEEGGKGSPEGDYDSIQEYFESDEGSEFVDSQEEYLLDLFGDIYSDIQFTAEDDLIIYAYTYIEEQDASMFEDLLSEAVFDSDFETWESATGISEMSINVIYYNPDGSELYNETFSNF